MSIDELQAGKQTRTGLRDLHRLEAEGVVNFGSSKAVQEETDL